LVDSLKITTPIIPRDNVHNLPKQAPAEGVFDLTNPSVVIKTPPRNETAEKNPYEQNLLQSLNKDILAPLFKDTNVLADGLKKIVLLSKVTASAEGVIPKELVEKLFITPSEMLGTLLDREQGETVFSGVFFDNLRILSKIETQPRLRDAITAVLKYFDSYANQQNSLDAITTLNKSLPGQLLKADRPAVEACIARFNELLSSGGENHKEILKFLKNEYIPVLSQLVKRYNQEDKIRNNVMAVIHNVVRLDKGDPMRLEDAAINLNEELRIITNLSDESLEDLKNLLLLSAREARSGKPVGTAAALVVAGEGAEAVAEALATTAAAKSEEKDLAHLIAKTLDSSESTTMIRAAQNLLTYLVQSESPVLPIMHFMIPIRFEGDDTYGEFFIDKDCEERKGDAKKAQNIFFIIQSDKHGTFEVDLLAKDQFVELNIRCPEGLVDNIKGIRGRMRELVEGQGYRLSQYAVDKWKDNQSIVERFPKFAIRKAGIDVKI